MKLYLSKLNPESEAFFQYPKNKNWAPNNPIWYDNKPLGVNKLGSMMKDISQAAELSQIYTNHSVRATAITLWSNAGVANRHIMAISGHRNEQSLSHYNTRPSSVQLHHCSEVLSRSLDQRPANTVNMLNQPSLQLSTAIHQNNIVVSGPLGYPPTNFKSIFSDCTIQNVHVILPSCSDENK